MHIMLMCCYCMVLDKHIKKKTQFPYCMDIDDMYLIKLAFYDFSEAISPMNGSPAPKHAKTNQKGCHLLTTKRINHDTFDHNCN